MSVAAFNAHGCGIALFGVLGGGGDSDAYNCAAQNGCQHGLEIFHKK